ncbi:MAG: hypothetical protein ACFBSD_12200 [Paracoccaceae bacterium]
MSDDASDIDEFAKVPAEREAVSFRTAVDATGRFLNLKLAFPGGKTEVLILAAPIALHIRDRLRETLRAAPSLTELPEDRQMFARQPHHSEADWRTASPHVGVPRGCEVATFRDRCVLAFPMDGTGTYTAVRLRPLIAGYLLHAINFAVEDEDLGAEDAAAGRARPHA